MKENINPVGFSAKELFADRTTKNHAECVDGNRSITTLRSISSEHHNVHEPDAAAPKAISNNDNEPYTVVKQFYITINFSKSCTFIDTEITNPLQAMALYACSKRYQSALTTNAEMEQQGFIDLSLLRN